jgi:hypothetical protein
MKKIPIRSIGAMGAIIAAFSMGSTATGAPVAETPAAPKAAASSPAAALHLPAPAAAAMAGIDPERIRAHVRFLADDLLEGRGPGVRGGDIAAKYIAAQFEQLGLKPAGDNGTYLQQVNFKGVLTQPSSSASISGQGAPLDLKLVQDYVITNETQTETADVDAPIVFVGFGIDAPEYQWNDYDGVDVKGKVVLVIVNEPPSSDQKFFTGEALTYYGRWVYKYEQAARQGAVGAIIIHRTDLASYDWDVVRNSWSTEQVFLRDDRDPKLKAAAWVQQDIARKMMASSGLELDAMIKAAGQRGFKARELPLRFKAHTVSEVREFQSPNVLGILPGTQAGAARQAVVYSAHYDHLGIDPRIQGDQIYNGAVDNATGCGVLLELARAYAKSGARPPQPVLFAAVTAEESGLLGLQLSGQASADSRRANCARPELRCHPARGHSGVGEPRGRGAHQLLSRGETDRSGLSLRHPAGPGTGRRTLLSLRSLQPGAHRRAGVHGEPGLEVQGTAAGVGQGAAGALHRKELSPSQRRVHAANGFHRQRHAGALWLRIGLAGHDRARHREMVARG